MKFMRPDLIREMTDIELFVAGYDRAGSSEPDKSGEQSDEHRSGTVV
jgi:hypothetical protein